MGNQLRTVLAATLCLWVSQATAQETWHSGATKAEAYALNMNKELETIGIWCSRTTSECIWAVLVNNPCVEAEEADALVSSNAGSKHVKLLCGGEFKTPRTTYYRMFLQDFSSVDDIVRSSDRLGIAIAVKNGQFSVMRWNTTGAASVLDALRVGLRSKPPVSLPKSAT